MANTTSKQTVDYSARNAALSALSSKLGEGKKQAKAEREAAKAAKKAAKVEQFLGVLNSGEPTAKSSTWGARFALRKAVQAVKDGATAEQLKACKALQAVAPWGELVEPVTEYCKALLVDPAVVLEGLNADGPQEAPQAAPEPAQEAPKAKAAPKATPKATGARKPRQASGRGKGRKAA